MINSVRYCRNLTFSREVPRIEDIVGNKLHNRKCILRSRSTKHCRNKIISSLLSNIRLQTRLSCVEIGHRLRHYVVCQTGNLYPK